MPFPSSTGRLSRCIVLLSHISEVLCHCKETI